MVNLNDIVLILTSFYFNGLVAQNPKGPVSQKCLACLCEASSSCDTTLGCDTTVCGPFRITRPYWVDAGMPTINNQRPDFPTAFENCTSDMSCSIRTIQGHMFGHQKDCNGDNRIDCDDFIRIHKLGSFGCDRPIQGSLFDRYQRCKEEIDVNEI